MVRTLVPKPMAQRKAETSTIRINKEYVRRANVVAAYREISAPDYLNGLVGPLIDRDYEALFNSGKIQAEPGKEAPE